MKISIHTLLLSFALVLGFASQYVLAADEEMADKPGYIVNINTAEAEELASMLSGVGMSRAQAIVSYRKDHGNFESVDDLLMVQGIGEKTLENNRHLLAVASEAKE